MTFLCCKRDPTLITAIPQLFTVTRIGLIPSLSYIKLKHYMCPLHTSPHTTFPYSDMC